MGRRIRSFPNAIFPVGKLFWKARGFSLRVSSAALDYQPFFADFNQFIVSCCSVKSLVQSALFMKYPTWFTDNPVRTCDVIMHIIIMKAIIPIAAIKPNFLFHVFHDFEMDVFLFTQIRQTAVTLWDCRNVTPISKLFLHMGIWAFLFLHVGIPKIFLPFFMFHITWNSTLLNFDAAMWCFNDDSFQLSSHCFLQPYVIALMVLKVRNNLRF